MTGYVRIKKAHLGYYAEDYIGNTYALISRRENDPFGYVSHAGETQAPVRLFSDAVQTVQETYISCVHHNGLYKS